MLERSVVEKSCSKVLETSVVEKSVGEESCRGRCWRRVL